MKPENRKGIEKGRVLKASAKKHHLSSKPKSKGDFEIFRTSGGYAFLQDSLPDLIPREEGNREPPRDRTERAAYEIIFREALFPAIRDEVRQTIAEERAPKITYKNKA